jgi:pimeloyl-ACP methyl ester carboxylesterase
MIASVRGDLAIDGCRECPAFVGPSAGAVFACLHLPSQPARGMVVLCSSIGDEWKFNYRRETLLARRLAKLGVAAVRLHYLGPGHSDDGEITFRWMVDDVDRVRDWACRQAGVEQVAYFGSRFGALVAAAAGRETRSPLACWNAPSTGTAYFRELFRILRVGHLLRSGTLDDMPAPENILRSGQPLDVLGYTLGPALYLSACTISFAVELGPPPRRVKLVEIGDDHHKQQAVGHAVSLGEQGLDVAASVVEDGRSWWFQGWFHDTDWRAEEHREVVGRLIEETAAWLAAVAGGEASDGS